MPDSTPQLTPRQLQIARLLYEGLSNKAIAEELQLAEGTVKVYLADMFEKLGVNSRLQVALWAKGKGFNLCFPEVFTDEPKS